MILRDLDKLLSFLTIFIQVLDTKQNVFCTVLKSKYPKILVHNSSNKIFVTSSVLFSDIMQNTHQIDNFFPQVVVVS